MRRPAVAFCLAALSLAACGVPDDEGPRALSPQLVPTATPMPSTAPASRVSEPVALYFVTGDGLVRAATEVPAPAGPRGALRALLEQGAVPAGARSAIPGGTEVLGSALQSGTLVVDLSGELRGATGPELRLAVAQLVYTATEFASTEAVRLRVDGQPVRVPDRGATLSGSPLTRAEYADLAPS